MERTLFFTALFAAFVSFAPMSFADGDYVEQGRFGVEGFVLSNGFQTGVTRETDTYESGLDFYGNRSTSNGLTSSNLGVNFRAGKRVNIGTFNYFSFGLSGQTFLFSKTAGVANNGSYNVGPYIGFQRHFSGTSLMLSIFVLPFDYAYTPAFEGTPSTQNWQFFELGGFGVALLF